MKLKHYISKFLTLFSVVALLATNLFADNLCNEEITTYNRNGTSNIGGSIDLTSGFGSTTTLGFGYSHSNSDRSLNLYSSYNAPSLLEQVRQGVHGIDHVKMDPALALHKFSSAAILQMTAPRDRMDMSIVRDLWNISKLSQLGESSTTSGIIIFKDALIRDFKKAHFDESEEKIQEKKDGTKALTGGPKGEDPDDEEKKKKFKKSNFEKGDKIDVSRFYERQSKSGQRATQVDPKTGDYLERDLASGSGREHGGSHWKAYTKRGDPLGTFTEDGKFLREISKLK